MVSKAPDEIVNGLEAIKDFGEGCNYAKEALKMPEIVPLSASDDDKKFLLSACVQACEVANLGGYPSSAVSCDYAKEALEMPEVESTTWYQFPSWNQFLVSKSQACEAAPSVAEQLNVTSAAEELNVPSTAEQDRALNQLTTTKNNSSVFESFEDDAINAHPLGDFHHSKIILIFLPGRICRLSNQNFYQPESGYLINKPT